MKFNWLHIFHISRHLWERSTKDNRALNTHCTWKLILISLLEFSQYISIDSLKQTSFYLSPNVFNPFLKVCLRVEFLYSSNTNSCNIIDIQFMKMSSACLLICSEARSHIRGLTVSGQPSARIWNATNTLPESIAELPVYQAVYYRATRCIKDRCQSQYCVHTSWNSTFYWLED